MKACRPLLGTYVEIRVDHVDAATARAAVDAGFAAISRVDRLMSAFADDSDLARINRLAHRQAVAVDPWTRDVVSLACRIHAASDGLFDCGVAPHLAAWEMLPASDDSEATDSSLAHLAFTERGEVRCGAPTRLDLGGIAKGFAVDRACEAILATGAAGAVVNAGGDLRVAGDCAEEIYLRDPGDPEQLRHAGTLRDGACATSATYYSRRRHGNREVSALVHPRTGEAVTTRRSYTVIAPSCAVADALTKVLALCENPQHPCFSLYEAHPIILDHS